jgi:hypothetical protein
MQEEVIRVREMISLDDIPVSLEEDIPEYRNWVNVIENYNTFETIIGLLPSRTNTPHNTFVFYKNFDIRTQDVIRAHLYSPNGDFVNLENLQYNLREYLQTTYRFIYNLLEQPILRTLYGTIDTMPLKKCISAFYDLSNKVAIIVDAFDRHIGEMNEPTFTQIYNEYTSEWFIEIIDKLIEITNQYYFVPSLFKLDIQIYKELNFDLYHYHSQISVNNDSSVHSSCSSQIDDDTVEDEED